MGAHVQNIKGNGVHNYQEALNRRKCQCNARSPLVFMLVMVVLNNYDETNHPQMKQANKLGK